MPPYHQLEQKLRDRVTKRRFLHSVRVRDTAAALAGMYRCDREKAEAAGLLHDVARDMPLITMQQLTSGQYETLPHEEVFYRPGLLHAYAGRVIVQQDFGIQDEDILRSIELHTTGGERMTVLNKVIFVADYIEPGRSFRGVEKARKIARRSLDEAVLYIYRATMGKLVSKGIYICINTLLGYNEQVLACRDDASLKYAGTSRTLQGV